jgi:hypothetical protein
MASPPSLWNTLPTGYGTKEDEFTLEQYKLYVDSSQKVSDRRSSTISYLLTINSSLLGFVGLLAGFLPDRKPLVLLCAAGVALCAVWLSLMDSLRQLNSAKFEVINLLESRLPANVFQEEWRRLGSYRPLTLTEKGVPWTLIFLYVVLAGVLWVWTGTKDDQAKKIQIESPIKMQITDPVTVISPAPPAPPPAVSKARTPAGRRPKH